MATETQHSESSRQARSDEYKTVMNAQGDLNIPRELREALHVGEHSLFEVEVTPEGELLLRPCGTIDPDQAWFWTPEWQEGERQADREIAEGRVRRHMSDEEFLRSFEQP
ncbi:MAG TPA: AbrB/MazE/SpoVT family DNA-binding domain-containing protein [Ktedonobacterales bacterium]